MRTINCPHGFEVPFDPLKVECRYCSSFECVEDRDIYRKWKSELLELRENLWTHSQDIILTYYHTIGVEINKKLLGVEPTREKKILRLLSKELRVGETTLYAARKLATLYPSLQNCPAKSWPEAKKMLAAIDMRIRSCQHNRVERKKRLYCLDCKKWIMFPPSKQIRAKRSRV